MRAALIAFASALVAVAARADEFSIKLRPGPGADAVNNYCAACHSLDYILMNAGFLDAKAWEAETNKMIKAFGAPIAEADAKAIKDYLTANYGK